MAERIKDLYAVLGVSKDATEKEIKAAYRELSKKYHPDVNNDENANEIFKELKVAYEVLMDPKSRQQYDEDVEKEKNKKKTITFDDIYKMFEEKTGVHSPVKGEEVHLSVPFSAEEIRQGATKTITFERFVNCEGCQGHRFNRRKADVCPSCKGHGYRLSDTVSPFGQIKTEVGCNTCDGHGYVNRTDCDSCNGKGKVLKAVKVQFKLPVNTQDGLKLLLSEKGDTGINGGKNGDLIVTLKEEPHSKYKINNFDLSTTVDIEFEQLGQKVSVLAPSGETITFSVPVEAQDGHQMIIENEGLLDPSTGTYGNLYIQLRIKAPAKLTKSKFSRILEIIRE